MTRTLVRADSTAGVSCVALPTGTLAHPPVTQSVDHSIDDRPTPRREFLGQIAASAIVLAGTACPPPPATAGTDTDTAPTPAPAPQPAIAPAHGADAVGRLLVRAAHREAQGRVRLAADRGRHSCSRNASGYIRGMRDALGAGDDDVQVVIVIRHAAIPMAFNDAMWAKYEIGKDKKDQRLPRATSWATRNPYLRGGAVVRATARGRLRRRIVRSRTLSWLGSHGHILLGCDLASAELRERHRRKFKSEQRVVYEELKANLLPGVILQPTGVYAVLRAQEAGCAFFKST